MQIVAPVDTSGDVTATQQPPPTPAPAEEKPPGGKVWFFLIGLALLCAAAGVVLAATKVIDWKIGGVIVAVSLGTPGVLALGRRD